MYAKESINNFYILDMSCRRHLNNFTRGRIIGKLEGGIGKFEKGDQITNVVR